MAARSIPELSEELQSLRRFFSEEANSFTHNVRVSTDRFTQQDREDFDQLLTDIRHFALSRINDFIHTRITAKSFTFKTHFDGFHQSTAQLQESLNDYRDRLEEASRKLKAEETEKEILLERVSDKHARTESLKKVMRSFKQNAERRLGKKKVERKMQTLYKEKLMHKCFFPWRALTYKDGYENQVKRHSHSQLRKIHEEFGCIVDTLKQKVMETEELIRVKRAAKGEFTYALSKNLLKTISNLSLEVMSLNQVAAKDRSSQEQTEQFMNEVNRVIKQRLASVSVYKETMYETVVEREVVEEPREAPQASGPVPKATKRISFA